MRTNIKTYLDGKALGLVSAHPDDVIPHAHLIRQAQELGVSVHEIVHTKGKESPHNFKAGKRPRFSVRRGDRAKEGADTATFLGFASYAQHDAEDGNLEARETPLASVTANWALNRRINVLGTLATGDHRDHASAVRIARMASAILLQEHRYELDLLELRAPGESIRGDLLAGATDDSMALAYNAAAQNGSQFEMSPDTRPGWPVVPGGMSMEPQSFDRLRQYPLLQDAFYRFIPAGQLVVAQTTLATPASTVYYA